MAAAAAVISYFPAILLVAAAAVASVDGEGARRKGGAAAASGGCYSSVFSFGDSLSDAGNIAVITNNSGFTVPPYGMTFFGKATGRACNGRLIVDFLAEELGLPLLPPYLAGGDFTRGANFAVLGATAVNNTYFEGWGVQTGDTYLGTQAGWAVKVLKANPGLAKKTMFLVGEIGGNDYNGLVDISKSMDQIRGIAPIVVGAISDAVTALVEAGAVTVVVPSNMPVGCAPFFMKLFPLLYTSVEYDDRTGCIDTLNELSRHHNALLRLELSRIQALHPKSSIIFFDLYTSVYDIILSPLAHGFTGPVTSACCGGGGSFNFNFSAVCGHPGGATACADPTKYIFWDGAHLTEAAYKIVAADLVSGRHSYPSVSLSGAGGSCSGGGGRRKKNSG